MKRYINSIIIGSSLIVGLVCFITSLHTSDIRYFIGMLSCYVVVILYFLKSNCKKSTKSISQWKVTEELNQRSIDFVSNMKEVDDDMMDLMNEMVTSTPEEMEECEKEIEDHVSKLNKITFYRE